MIPPFLMSGEEMEPQILVTEKDHYTYVVMGETIEEAALKLLKKRVDEEFWYLYEEDKDRANNVVNSGNGKAAWIFLLERRHAEYEWVDEVITI